LEREPVWLSREQIDAIHQFQIETFGGLPGLLDEGGLESAIAAPRHLYSYEDVDVFEIGAAYAFAIARNHPYVEANKRTAMQAATDFLRLNGIDIRALGEQEQAAYDAMMAVAKGELDRTGLAQFFRRTLG
jgi:death-on-curing protein